MHLVRGKVSPAITLGLLLLGSLWSLQLPAQTNCQQSTRNIIFLGTSVIEVCLPDFNSIGYDPATAPKNINFFIRSHSPQDGNHELPYRVTISSIDDLNYTLDSASGVDSADFSLSFSDGVKTESLTPGHQSGDFSERRQLHPVSLPISLINPESLSGNSYSGTFRLRIEQQNCNYIFWNLCTAPLEVEFTISLAVPTRAVVENLNDMDLTSTGVSPGQPIQGFEDICVGGIGFANYNVRLESQNGSTSSGAGIYPYQLNGLSESLPYDVEFIDNTSSTSGIAPTPLGNIDQSFPRNGTESCIVDNARVIVAVSDWDSANESTYTDTLTVTVTPQ
ncbi:hypothetical protein [Microbulbifer litoralis]|uniref:hypothetical protein n=1 Tax=Microbulbifer litoralis TaxID=2933965 RepID=UPI0020293DA0|nr:hypothetical protein [Microbulbifer sp. GX H0434]